MKLRDNLPLFCFDLANNHMGDFKHSRMIISLSCPLLPLGVRMYPVVLIGKE